MTGPMSRDKSQQHRDDAPEQRVRHADAPQPNADQHAEAGVERGLREQIAAETPSGVIQTLGGALQIVRAGEANEPVTNILPLEQEEHHEDDDDAGGCQRLNQRADDGLDDLQCRRIGLMYFDRHRLRRLGGMRHLICLICRGRGLAVGRRRGPGDLAGETPQHARRASDDAAAGGRTAQRVDLVFDVALIGRQILGQVRELAANDRADAEDHQKRQQDRRNDRGYAAEVPSAQQQHQRSEREAQQDRQRKRHKDLASKVQRRDDDDADGKGCQRRTRVHEGVVGPRRWTVGHDGLARLVAERIVAERIVAELVVTELARAEQVRWCRELTGCGCGGGCIHPHSPGRGVHGCCTVAALPGARGRFHSGSLGSRPLRNSPDETRNTARWRRHDATTAWCDNGGRMDAWRNWMDRDGDRPRRATPTPACRAVPRPRRRRPRPDRPRADLGACAAGRAVRLGRTRRSRTIPGFGRQWWSVADRTPAGDGGRGAPRRRLPRSRSSTPNWRGLELPADAYALMGFSQGAMTVLFTGLRRATAPRAILAFSGALIAPDTLGRGTGQPSARPAGARRGRRGRAGVRARAMPRRRCAPPASRWRRPMSRASATASTTPALAMGALALQTGVCRHDGGMKPVTSAALRRFGLRRADGSAITRRGSRRRTISGGSATRSPPDIALRT